MKKLIFFLTLFSLSFSAFAQDIKADLYGNWVCESYIQAVESGASALKAEKSMKWLQEFVFDPVFGDKVLISFFNMEGDYVPFRISPEAEISFTVDDETGPQTVRLRLEGSGADKRLVMQMAGSQEVYRFAKELTGTTTAVATVLNQKLFAGAFLATDPQMMAARSPGQKIIFNANGTIEGLEGYGRYEILANFDDIADFDLVRLSTADGSRSDWFGWEKEGRDLILYRVTEGDTFTRGPVYLQLSFRP